MWLRISATVLIAFSWGCGNRDGTTELETYITALRKLHHYNRKIQDHIDHFDNPELEAGANEVETVRKLIDDYARRVRSLGEPEDPALQKIHELYVRSFDETVGPERARSAEPEQRRDAEARRLRRLRRDIRDLVYPALRVLLARRNLEGSEYTLQWPR